MSRSTSNNFYRRTLPDVCIGFCSVKGKQVFKEALDRGFMDMFFSLGPQLRTQDEPAYCGLSSLVMILNALAVDPGKIWKGVWRWYHEDMLDCCTPLEEVKLKGVSMAQLSCIAKCNQLESRAVFVDGTNDISMLRSEIMQMCKSDDVGLIACFGRKVLGQSGTGHFAPIGGYHPEEDLVLILEPARFKYPPFWIPLLLLWEAMNTIDTDNGEPRGYLVLKRSNSQPTLLFRISRLLHAMNPVNADFMEFMKHALPFLQQKVADVSDTNSVLLVISKKLLEISANYKQCGRNLFFTRMTESEFRSFSPEHQDATSLLVESIESTEIYKTICKDIGSLVCCRQTLFDMEAESSGCSEAFKSGKRCVLCYPHYLTILMFVLPVFSPDGDLGSHSNLSLTEEDYPGSYLEEVTNLTRKCLEGEMKVSSFQSDLPEDSDLERAVRGRHLLLNEIDQLQKQLSNVLQNSCRTCVKDSNTTFVNTCC